MAPPVRIKTVPHEPWTAKRFPILKPLVLIAMEIIQEHFNIDLLEYCNSLYQNFYFLVGKSNRKYQLINTAVFLNRVLVKDTNLPLSADEFSEEFGEIAVTLIVDLFSEYNQMPLAPESQDMTAFQTLIRLLQMMMLPQGWTNLVLEFV